MSRCAMRLVLVLTAALLLLLPAAAFAQRGKIIRDCADDGRLQGNYSQSEIRDARRNLPSDVAEYTDCEDVLRRAEAPAGGSGTGSGSTGTGTPTLPSGGATTGGAGEPTLLQAQTPEDHEALADAGADAHQPVTVSDQQMVPGAVDLRPEVASNGLPTSLIVVVALLGALALAAAVALARRATSEGFLRSARLPWRR